MEIFKVIYLQFFICILIFLSLTTFRLFDEKSFDDFSAVFSKYAYFDTDLSLIYEGE